MQDQQQEQSQQIQPFAAVNNETNPEEFKKSDFFQDDFNTFSRHSVHFLEFIDQKKGENNEDEQGMVFQRIYDINADKEYNLQSDKDELKNLFQQFYQCPQMKNLWRSYWKQVEKNTELYWDYCECGDVEKLNDLLSKQMINLNATWSRDNYNAVHYTCVHGYLDILQILHDRGCNTNAVTSFGRSPLHLASIRGAIECAQYLVDNNLCDLNGIDQSRSTALHYASANNHHQIVKILLDSKVDTSIKNEQGLTAEDMVYGINTFTVFEQYHNSLASSNGNDSSNSLSSQDTRYYSKYSIAGSVVRPGRCDQIMKLLQNCSSHKKLRSCLLKSSFMADQDVISKDDFTLVRQLGIGGFGEVNLVQYSKNKQFYAIKIMRKDLIMKRSADKYIIQERQTLEKVKGHPFMCQLHFAFQDFNRLYLVLEYIQGEDLSKLLFREDSLDEKVTKMYIAELVCAIEYLHQKGIIYRDLKPENVLIDIDGHIKLVDFGLVKMGMVGRKKTLSFCGTAAYLSPEMINQKGHNFAVDWYGVGILTYELMYGENPFMANDAQTVFTNVQSKRLKKPSSLSNSGWDFIQSLMCKDPKYRLGTKSSSEVKNHSWFSDINWDDVYQKKLKTPKYDWMKDNLLKNIQKSMNTSNNNRQNNSTNQQRQMQYEDYDFEDMEIGESSATVQTESTPSNSSDPSQLPYFYNWSFY